MITILMGHRGIAADGELILETGGVQIVLASGWEPLEQPTNYFVQKRARNVERGIALSAGWVTSELPAQQFAVLGAAALMTGSTDAELDALASQLRMPRSEVDKALASEIGKQMLEHLKQQSRSMRTELFHEATETIPGGTRYEIQSKGTMLESGQVFYSRQFLMQGATSRDVVTITYAGASEEIFKQQDLVNAIRPPAGGASSADGEAVNYYSQGMDKGKKRDYAGAIADFSKAIGLKPCVRFLTLAVVILPLQRFPVVILRRTRTFTGNHSQHVSIIRQIFWLASPWTHYPRNLSHYSLSEFIVVI